MITFTRAEIRTGTGWDRGQRFVMTEDADQAILTAIFDILNAAGRDEDIVREAIEDAGYLWRCSECGWYGTFQDTQCDECGAAHAA